MSDGSFFAAAALPPRGRGAASAAYRMLALAYSRVLLTAALLVAKGKISLAPPSVGLLYFSWLIRHDARLGSVLLSVL